MPTEIVDEKPRRVKMSAEETRKRGAESARRWYHANKVKAHASYKKWVRENPDKARAGKASWRRRNKDAVNKTAKLWRDANKKRLNAKSKKCYHDNKEHFKKACKKWYRANYAKARAARRRWRLANHEKAKAFCRAWGKTLRGRASSRNKEHRRRAQIGSKTVTVKQIEMLLRRAKQCHYCEKKFTRELPVTIDHILPLIKGGTHTRGNLCAACSPCNSAKNAKHPDDFAREIGRLLL